MRSAHSPQSSFKSLITGAGGQTGYWLGKDLEASGRKVFRSSSLCGDFQLHGQDRAGIWDILDDSRPDEIYHLACPSMLEDTAQFERDVFKMSVDVVLTFLRWIVERSPKTRFFFAGSSEIFGRPRVTPQDEFTSPTPMHPYAVAKLAGDHLVDYFRESKGVFGVTGILYNHESHLRRSDFVSKRIAEGVASIVNGRKSHLKMGNLQAVRDWTHASDFARGFRLSLEAERPGNYIFASGIGRSVEDFCKVAFGSVGLNFRDYIVQDQSLFRLDSPLPRVGNIEKARRDLGWEPKRIFEEWVGEMVKIEINRQLESPE
jgi:GDPmannose 4,6-dehydratase